MRGFCIGLFALLFTAAGMADESATASSPQIEQRAMRLAEVLRCLVCQNQSIADSNAPLARDLKRQIKDQIGQGRSDTEILEYMVARYGDFILYRPPVKATTVLLWGGPFAALLVALVVLAIRLSRSSRNAAQLSLEDQSRAVELLGMDGRWFRK